MIILKEGGSGLDPDLLGAFRTLDLEANVSPALCLKKSIMKCYLKVPVLYGRQEATKGVLINIRAFR